MDSSVIQCHTKNCNNNNRKTSLSLVQQQSEPQTYSNGFHANDSCATMCSTSAPLSTFHKEHMELLPSGNSDFIDSPPLPVVATIVRPNNINISSNNSDFKTIDNSTTTTTTMKHEKSRLKIPISNGTATKRGAMPLMPSKKFNTTNSNSSGLNVKTTKNVRLSSRSIQLGNLVRTKLYSSFPNLHNQVVKKEACLNSGSTWYNDEDSICKVLKAVASDHVVSTPTEDNKFRRTVYIERTDDEKFGFIIQSYAFRRRNKNQMEQITYVDYVALDGPAFRSGLRAGDVILGINGKNIQNYGHNQLVRYIGECKTLRMVVLFENCVNRVELCTRAMKLNKLLADKEFEMRTLLLQEERLLKGLPILSQDEILTLLRTPSCSPSLDRFSRQSSSRNRCSSIPSDEDVFSSISIASTSYNNPDNDIIENFEENDNDDAVNPNMKIRISKRYSDSSVKFIVGSGETNSSRSDGSSLTSGGDLRSIAEVTSSPVRVVVNVESCSTMSDDRSQNGDTENGDHTIVRVNSVTRL